jgi:hypothetical protein
MGYRSLSSAQNYCESRLDDAPPPTCVRLEADNAARRKNVHLVAAFDFRRQFVRNGTRAEYDRISSAAASGAPKPKWMTKCSWLAFAEGGGEAGVCDGDRAGASVIRSHHAVKHERC